MSTEFTTDHVEEVRAMVPPQHAPIAAVLEGLSSGEPETAAAQPGEPAGCLDAAPTAAEPATASSADHADSELRRQAIAAAQRRAHGGKPVALYRNPADGSTWTGRGLKPRWLVEAIEAGRSQDEFLIGA